MESGSSVDSASLHLPAPPPTPKTRIEQMRLIRKQIQNDYPMDYRVHRHNEQLTELMMRVKEWREGAFTYDVHTHPVNQYRSHKQMACIKWGEIKQSQVRLPSSQMWLILPPSPVGILSMKSVLFVLG